MNLREGDRVVLLKAMGTALAAGAKGTVVSYHLRGYYEVRFDNGEPAVVSKHRLAKEQPAADRR